VRLVKVPAMKLKPGMFIAELDRPWLETPFALQGFMVHDNAEILYVADHVMHVYIDAEYTGGAITMEMAMAPTATTVKERLKLKDEFQRTKLSFDSAAQTLDRVFDALLNGEKTDIKAVQKAVNPLIEGVFRNHEAVSALVRLKDSGDYRYHHGVAMAVWAAILGRHLGLHRSELEKLAVGCAMCDVGMTQLPGQLLDQPENLTDRQRPIIRAHPEMGSQMVAKSPHVDMEVLSIIENHHERADGSGYPRGLEGAAIPLLARIAGIVDTYDAMITPRPYARARTSYEAVQELLDCKGSLFQEALVEQFVQAIGLFPTGTMVELNTGEVAVVVKQNITRRLKPELVVVLDAQQQRLEKPRAVNLAYQDKANEGERWISRELIAGTFGINNEEFFI
jgi:HD-GYP domain-containing protein (c-di-GMP phosphodiesterase class II)